LGAHTEDPSKKNLNKKLRLKSDPYGRFNLTSTTHRIHGVNYLVRILESIFCEWEQNWVRFVSAIEKNANMTRLIKLGTSKRNGSRGLSHAHPKNTERRPKAVEQ
jgi:hypothetical protein